MDAQRRALDELMGAGTLHFISLSLSLLIRLPIILTVRLVSSEILAARNLTEEEKKAYREIRWDDKEVCGAFMVRFCPHDLFVNTKSDLGEFAISTLIFLKKIYFFFNCNL